MSYIWIMNSLRNLDLNLLIIFEAIYTAENISKAAKHLGVSQPTISNALTRLRNSLDDKLFIRAGRANHHSRAPSFENDPNGYS